MKYSWKGHKTQIEKNKSKMEMTKTYKKTCGNGEDRSACISAQSDQSLCWLHVLSTASRLSKKINENPCYTGWMYWLIWVFSGQIDLIVGFVTLAQISFFFLLFLAHLSSAQDELLWSLFVRRLSVRASVRPCVRPLTFSNDFSSEAAKPILLKFHMEPP